MRWVFILLSTIILFQGSSERVWNSHEDLSIIVDASEREGFHLDEWEVVYLDEKAEKDSAEIKSTLQLNHSVTEEKNAQLKRYIFEPKKQQNLFDYKIILVEPIADQGKKRIQIIITGTKWNEVVAKEYELLTNRLHEFHGFDLKENYTCVKLDDGGIMNDGISVKNLLNYMQVVHRQEQEDNITESAYEKNVYGYSPILAQAIDVQSDKINLQLTIREMTNNKKQVIIGTPVILNEY